MKSDPQLPGFENEKNTDDATNSFPAKILTSSMMQALKALSIRQPWAWLIVNGHKDIENRSWPTHFRGSFLIHASKGMTRDEYDEAEFIAGSNGITIPPFDQLDRGGIVGVATIAGCVNHSASPWFFGEWGFVIQEAKPLPFIACKGALGFFKPTHTKP